jgi:menaquinone-dependent protoporphyrinogen oxidase
MSVLVAFASKYGSTRGVAERIATTLEASGLTVDLQPIQTVSDVGIHEACVIGSAVYAFHWMKPAVRFVERNRAPLAGRRVWLFSVGPLGPKTDPIPRPRDFDELSEAANARDHHIFYGAVDLGKLRGGDRLMRRFFKGFEGDFRDWEEIEAWAGEIAQELAHAPAPSG